MSRKTGEIAILQFDRRRISVLRVRRSVRGVEVLGFTQEQGPWSIEDGSLEAALRRFVKTRRVADDTVYTVLPRHEMTARLLTLPTQDRDEIGRMLLMSAEEFTPYPVHELVISHGIVQRLSDGHARVMAVLAHRDVVESHLAVLRGAGIEPEAIYVSTACLASAAIASQRSEDERFALVHLGSSGLDILVLAAGRLEHSRGVETTRDWSLTGPSAEEAVEELTAEVRSSLSAYRRDSAEGMDPERIYVCSDGGEAARASEALAEATGYACSEARFTFSWAGKVTEPVGGGPMVALGAALAAQGRAAMAIRLEPESLVQARKVRQFRGTAMRAAAVGVALLAGLGVYLGQLVYARQAYVRDVQTRIAQVKPLAENVARKRERLAALGQHVDRSGTALELLSHVCDLAPSPGLNITQFTFTNREGILVEGRAGSVAIVDSFANAIRELGRSKVPLFLQARSVWQEGNEFGQSFVTYKIEIPFPQEDGAEEPGGE